MNNTHTSDIKNTKTYQHILSSLYGQAYADAYAMPSELWTRPQVKAFFNTLTTFLPGPAQNIAASEFVAGQFTDDTSQAIALIESFTQTQGIIDPSNVAKHIMAWAEKINAFEKNILGPSSKQALTKIAENTPVEELENLGTTNGAAMRISPVGMLTPTNNIDLFEKNIYNACACTHKSDVAIAGAGAIAHIISKQIDGQKWENTLLETIEFTQYLQNKYHNTFSPFIHRRIKLGLELAEKYLEKTQTNTLPPANILTPKDEEFSQDVYELIGTDMQTYNSVPAAFAIAHYCQNNPLKIATISANLGGDTDTIGAMSLAMASASYTCDIYPHQDLQLLSESNGVDFTDLAEKITVLRGRLDKEKV